MVTIWPVATFLTNDLSQDTVNVWGRVDPFSPSDHKSRSLLEWNCPVIAGDVNSVRDWSAFCVDMCLVETKYIWIFMHLAVSIWHLSLSRVCIDFCTDVKTADLQLSTSHRHTTLRYKLNIHETIHRQRNLSTQLEMNIHQTVFSVCWVEQWLSSCFD